MIHAQIQDVTRPKREVKNLDFMFHVYAEEQLWTTEAKDISSIFKAKVSEIMWQHSNQVLRPCNTITFLVRTL
jgi:hypothetical protein